MLQGYVAAKYADAKCQQCTDTWRPCAFSLHASGQETNRHRRHSGIAASFS